MEPDENVHLMKMINAERTFTQSRSWDEEPWEQAFRERLKPYKDKVEEAKAAYVESEWNALQKLHGERSGLVTGTGTEGNDWAHSLKPDADIDTVISLAKKTLLLRTPDQYKESAENLEKQTRVYESACEVTGVVPSATDDFVRTSTKLHVRHLEGLFLTLFQEPGQKKTQLKAKCHRITKLGPSTVTMEMFPPALRKRIDDAKRMV